MGVKGKPNVNIPVVILECLQAIILHEQLDVAIHFVLVIGDLGAFGVNKGNGVVLPFLQPEDEIREEVTNGVGVAVVIRNVNLIIGLVEFTEHPPVELLEAVVWLAEIFFELCQEINFTFYGNRKT